MDWTREQQSFFSEKSGGVPHHRRCSIVLGKFSREIFIDLRRDGCDKKIVNSFQMSLMETVCGPILDEELAT